MKIRFANVGRDKKTWEEEIPVNDGLFDGMAMLRSIRNHKALLSREVEITDDGFILAGLRGVGSWGPAQEATNESLSEGLGRIRPSSD
jgi:hypothetical protein